DDPVRAGPRSDLLEANVVQLGERRPHAVRAAVGIAVQLLDAAGKRLAGRGEGPEGPLVRRELDDALEPELALDLFDRLPGLVRNEVPHSGLEERVGDLGEAHAA